MQYPLIKNNPPAFIQLDQFLGVDFRTAGTQVAASRSPDAVNMMAGDNVFYPQKRLGYKHLLPSTIAGAANGLFPFGDALLVHVGTTLYRYKNEKIESIGAVGDHESTGFVMGGKFYFLDGSGYYVYDGAVFAAVSGYVPTTVVARLPAGGGTVLEDVNLLCAWRKNSFAGNGSAKEYFLDAKELDEGEVTVSVDGAALTTGFTVDRAAGKVVFATAPAAASGVDNVVITFAKTVAGNAAKIGKCTIASLYGGQNDTRVFLAGNPDEKNVDYQSGLYDPTYFPDRGYTRMGSDQSAIVGYAKQYDTQIVIKDTSAQDASIFLRQFELDASLKPMFPVRQGVAGVGCIARGSVAILEDTPLYLTTDGVYAVNGTNVYLERALQNRSGFVDAKLLAEPDLQKAVAAVYEGRYMLFVNGHSYTADSRQTYYDSTTARTQYEWYYWENIPAERVCVSGKFLYFLGKGMLYRFYRKEENGVYNDDGAAIAARWVTPLMNLGSWDSKKTARRLRIVLQPFSRSGCALSCMTDLSDYERVDETTMDILHFDEVDFGRFTFNALYSPQVWAIKANRKKIMMFSVKLENGAMEEGFGIYAISIEVG